MCECVCQCVCVCVCECECVCVCVKEREEDEEGGRRKLSVQIVNEKTGEILVLQLNSFVLESPVIPVLCFNNDVTRERTCAMLQFEVSF